MAAATSTTPVVDGAAGGLSFNYKALDRTLIDTMQLAEIVSLDEDKEHTFSRDIVEKWFQQAEETLPTLKEHLYVSFGRAAVHSVPCKRGTHSRVCGARCVQREPQVERPVQAGTLLQGQLRVHRSVARQGGLRAVEVLRRPEAAREQGVHHRGGGHRRDP